mmetsp:Transcript_2825/g.17587  ORF Transcript_2825/g.17587 Transcript_2825/m.17587 type:complete len:240 (+) Transcript_2825:192-911(+)
MGSVGWTEGSKRWEKSNRGKTCMLMKSCRFLGGGRGKRKGRKGIKWVYGNPSEIQSSTYTMSWGGTIVHRMSSKIRSHGPSWCQSTRSILNWKRAIRRSADEAYPPVLSSSSVPDRRLLCILLRSPPRMGCNAVPTVGMRGGEAWRILWPASRSAIHLDRSDAGAPGPHARSDPSNRLRKAPCAPVAVVCWRRADGSSTIQPRPPSSSCSARTPCLGPCDRTGSFGSACTTMFVGRRAG